MESVPTLVVGMSEKTSMALIIGGSVELAVAFRETLYRVYPTVGMKMYEASA
jgi:hypothetical protein